MSPRSLDVEVQRKGRRMDEFEIHADPDDTPVLREALRDWLRGNKWAPGRWPEFELVVRYAGENKQRKSVRA